MMARPAGVAASIVARSGGRQWEGCRLQRRRRERLFVHAAARAAAAGKHPRWRGGGDALS